MVKAQVPTSVKTGFMPPPSCLLPRDVWGVIAGFCASRNTLRLVCHQLHNCFAEHTVRMHTLRDATRRRLLALRPAPPRIMDMFEYRMGSVSETGFALESVGRMRQVRQLRLSLRGAQRETLLALQRIRGIERLEELSISLRHSKALTPHLLREMLRMWSVVVSLRVVDVDVHDCGLGLFSGFEWHHHHHPQRWQLQELRLDVSMNAIGDSGLHRLFCFIARLAPDSLRCVRANLELNNVGHRALQAACAEHLAAAEGRHPLDVSLWMWLNAVTSAQARCVSKRWGRVCLTVQT